MGEETPLARAALSPRHWDHTCPAGGCHRICCAGGLKVGVLKVCQEALVMWRGTEYRPGLLGGEKMTSSSSFCFSFFRRSSWPCQRKPQNMVILPLSFPARLTRTPHGSWYVLNLSPPLQNIAGFHGNDKPLWKELLEISSQRVQNRPWDIFS